MIRKFLLIVCIANCILLFANRANAQPKQLTYCNPINIDYGYTPIPDFATEGNHRATADPVITMYKGDYYLFSTNQWGYWWSSDMYHWNFVSRSFLRPEHHVYDGFMRPCRLGTGRYAAGIRFNVFIKFPDMDEHKPQSK